MDNIDLNKPAFGPDSQKINPEDTLPEESQSEKEIKEEEVQPEDSVEEQTVPYSRFKKFHQRALEAEREAAEWRERAQQFEPRFEKPENPEIPSYWRELYGDSDASVQAWKIQERQNELIKQEAREEAVKAVQEERYQEMEKVNSNLETIEENLEALSEYLGRTITEKEESELLEIIDEYTPQQDGRYLGPTIPFEKAWEILELRNKVNDSPRRQSRDSVASLSNSRSQGELNIEEKDKNFNPLDWGAYKRRIE